MSKNEFRKTFTYDGRRYYVRGDSQEDVLVKAALLKKDLDEGKHLVSKNTTVSAWAMECIETYKTNQKDVTKKKYISRVKHCILDEIGLMSLKSVKPLHCQRVLNLQEGKSKHQINQIYQALQFIFQKAVDNKLILENPASGIVKPSGYKNTRRSITEVERTHILKVAVTDRRFYLFLLMLHCGCRPSEAAEVMGKDISVVEGYPMLHIRGTKTRMSDRSVPIPAEFYNLIKDTPKLDYVACYRTGNKIEYSNRSRVWDSFKRELNISMGCKTYRNALVPPFPVAPDLVPYCLRHTYCTDLARSGVDLRIAQKLMGHSSITMTADIYTHIDNDDILNVAKQLERAKGVPNSI